MVRASERSKGSASGVRGRFCYLTPHGIKSLRHQLRRRGPYDSKEDAGAGGEVERLKMLGLSSSSVVVEFGVGTGQFSMDVAPWCDRVIAVDVSPPMLACRQAKIDAAKIGNVDVVQAGFVSYQHAGEPVDVADSRYAMHHLPDFWKGVALSRIPSILRPEGVLRLWDVVHNFEPGEAESWARRTGHVALS
jgi:SAM-dependent methyltransferase